MKIEYTDHQKALALRYVVEKFGEDMPTEETALLMEVYLDELINALPATEDEWVSVKVSMPEDEKEVLLCDENSNVNLGCYMCGKWILTMIGYAQISITHWQPLPIPPTP